MGMSETKVRDIFNESRVKKSMKFTNVSEDTFVDIKDPIQDGGKKKYHKIVAIRKRNFEFNVY